MKLIVNSRELSEVKKVLASLKTAKAVKGFNDIFSGQNPVGVTGDKNPFNEDEYYIIVPDEVATEVLRAISANGSDIGPLLKGEFSIARAGKYISVLRKIGTDISTAFGGR